MFNAKYIAKRLTIKQIDHRLKTRHGSVNFGIGVEHKDKWLIGSYQELSNTNNKDYLLFKDGDWEIFSYYDHLWAMWGYVADLDKKTKLKYSHTTEYHLLYGFISEKAIIKTRKDIKDDQDEFSDDEYVTDDNYIEQLFKNNADKYGGCIGLGRGDTDYHVYLAKNNGYIVAWALFTDDIVDDIVEDY